MTEPIQRSITGASGRSLCVKESGDGLPIVCVHGLTATGRYVLHGSRLLERSGFRVISYDARGHGSSDPAHDRAAYEYSDLVADLQRVVEAAGVERALLAGVSMGAASTLAFALAAPGSVAGLVQITPAHLGEPLTDVQQLARWDALADALEREGVEGFMRAYGEPPIGDRFRALVKQAIRHRIERHRHPAAVGDALRVVPRSTAFDGPQALASVSVPTLVVGSRDALDPEHPLAVSERYAELIPDAELVVEQRGKSPLAWRGAQLSKEILAWAQAREFIDRRDE